MSKINAPLRLLRAFHSAGKHLSFKLAANELHVTPPAISHQIKALEESLGIPLFTRNNRELSFTKAGAQYWKHVDKAITKLDRSTLILQQSFSQATLSISIMPPLADNLVIPNLASFQAQYPHIKLYIDSNIENIDVSNGDADIAIRFGHGKWPQLISEKLMDVYLQPIYPAKFATLYDFSQPKSVAKIPLVHMTSMPGAWENWFEIHNIEHAEPESEYHLNDYPAAINAAKSLGGALAIMPIEQSLVESGTVIAPLPAIGPLENAIYAVMKPEEAENPLILSFIQWIKALLKNSFSD